MVLLQPIGDEVADRADLEAVGAREIHQIVEPRHRPVVAHDLADDRARVEAGEARDVDRRLGMAGADEDSAGLGHQREDVSRGDELVRPMCRIDRNGDRASAVGGADSRRNALLCLDRDREGGLVAASVVVDHRLQAERVRTFLGQRKADEAAPVPGHEIDRVRSRHLRRNDEIAFILAVVVVDENEHSAVARFVDDRLGPDQHLRVAALDQLLQPPERIGGRIPVRRTELAQLNWGEGRPRGRVPRG